MEKTGDIDEKSLQEKGIRQLLKAMDLAYEIFLDSKIDLKTRQGWFREHTNAVLALNQILKDRREMGWDEEYQENEPALKNLLENSRPEPEVLEKLTKVPPSMPGRLDTPD